MRSKLLLDYSKFASPLLPGFSKSLVLGQVAARSLPLGAFARVPQLVGI